jgi:predicted MFS family arabinose efflux permease
MPLVVYILGLTIFSLTTSDFMVAGIMPSLSTALDVSIAEVGYLISIYAAGMVVGGPLLTLLLGVYGTANVIGNSIVGRFADRHIIPILVSGLIVLAATLAIFAVFADNRITSVVAFIVIGFVGVPMNPAMISRVMKTAHLGPLVNAVHTSVINIGLAGYGFAAPAVGWRGSGAARSREPHAAQRKGGGELMDMARPPILCPALESGRAGLCRSPML